MQQQRRLDLRHIRCCRLAPVIGHSRCQRRIGHSQRVDVILTNPPFGGEEEAGIKANFPPNL